MRPAISKVAVIGAGPAGLPTAKRLRDNGIEVVIFERSSVAGGMWVFREQKPIRPSFPSVHPAVRSSEPDRFSRPPEGQRLPFTEYYDDGDDDDGTGVWLRHAPPSPCYESLTSNIEIGLMKFEGHEYPPGTESYASHQCILEYLQRFAKDFKLDTITRYNTSVEDVRKTEDGNKSTWKLLSRHLSRDQHGKTIATWSEETFDAIVVASGHYDAEYIPDIPGLSKWAKKWPQGVLHAKEFRRPEDLDDRTVVIVGTGFSSLDIAQEISPFVKHIYQTGRDGSKYTPYIGGLKHIVRSLAPDNLTQVAEIERFGPIDHTPRACETQIFLKDGTVLEGVDKVIFCTGYLYELPFLKSTPGDLPPSTGKGSDNTKKANVGEGALLADGMQLRNLHKDIFYIDDPTLTFVGVPYGIATFPFFEVQAMAVAAVFTGKAFLPTVSEMKSEYTDRKAEKGEGRKLNALGCESERKYVEDIVGWINRDAERNGTGVKVTTGHDEKWYQTRLAAREGFLRNRLSRRDIYPSLDEQDIESRVQQYYKTIEPLTKARGEVHGMDPGEISA